MCDVPGAGSLQSSSPARALLEGGGGVPSGQSQSGCRAVTGDVNAVGGGGFWRLGMRLGLALGCGNAFGVESGQWGRGGTPPPPSSDSLPPPPWGCSIVSRNSGGFSPPVVYSRSKEGFGARAALKSHPLPAPRHQSDTTQVWAYEAF